MRRKTKVKTGPSDVIYVHETEYDRLHPRGLSRVYRSTGKACGQLSLSDRTTYIVGYKLVEVSRQLAAKIRGIPTMVRMQSGWKDNQNL
jgi:hypothetical protein